MASIDTFAALKHVIPRNRAYEILQEWDETDHVYFRDFVRVRYPDLFKTCEAYARVMGKRL